MLPLQDHGARISTLESLTASNRTLDEQQTALTSPETFVDVSAVFA